MTSTTESICSPTSEKKVDGLPFGSPSGDPVGFGGEDVEDFDSEKLTVLTESEPSISCGCLSVLSELAVPKVITPSERRAAGFGVRGRFGSLGGGSVPVDAIDCTDAVGAASYTGSSKGGGETEESFTRRDVLFGGARADGAGAGGGVDALATCVLQSCTRA